MKCHISFEKLLLRRESGTIFLISNVQINVDFQSVLKNENFKEQQQILCYISDLP